MNGVLERIKQITEKENITITSLEKKIGASKGVLSRAIANSTDIQSKWLIKIVENYPLYNTEWILTGQGSMLKSEEKDNGIVLEKTFSLKIEDAPMYVKPLVPLQAMAGVFSLDHPQVMEYECEMYSVPMLKDADFLIPVAGDSMYPTYNNGDVVACKKVPSWDFFNYGKVYVLYTSHGVLLKRIRQGSDNDHILIISDNEKGYPPFELHKKELQGVALVIGGLWVE